ncbi:MAG: tRNA 4-thiouridine(8) synthase ThiI [Thermodesulfovibrio sp.]|uniref:DUF814 domain-containing protein n=1 Tax=Thermodesulfovibrio obliviosus TaxID=3118332 RepID=A0AAU8H124_9BACT
MHRAIALYSGGLDSLLSIIIVIQQGIEVIAIKFLTGFTSPLKESDLEYARQFGFEIKEINIKEKFIEILKNPAHGYGKNLNPCIDCKILMLKEAKEKLSEFNASFVITGEVLSQRPMSQKREILKLIEKQATLKDLILRPLSAKILPPTKPEIQGVVNRELLYDIYGRTRKPQIDLAKKFGIEKPPQPAGGCLLTDPSFCRRVKDLMQHDELTVENVELLKIGRHFRISEKCKAIVGRDEEENKILLSKGAFIYPSDMKGPVVFLIGQYSAKDIDTAASICAFYSKRKEVVIKLPQEKIKIYDATTKEEIVKYRV